MTTPINTAPGSAGQNGALGEKWELVTCDDGHLFIGTGGDIVCHQDPNHAVGDEWDLRNFRLIAAAPQMIEACRIAAEELQIHGSLTYGLERAENFLLSAIAAATGGGRADA